MQFLNFSTATDFILFIKIVKKKILNPIQRSSSFTE